MKQSPEKFSWQKRAASFVFGWAGMKTALKSEHNLWIHLSAAVLAMIFGWLCGITSTEWVLVLLCISGVIALELINTALEKLCDIVQPSFHPAIRQVKDLGAAAVLVMAIIAVIAGCLIFGPHILRWFGWTL